MAKKSTRRSTRPAGPVRKASRPIAGASSKRAKRSAPARKASAKPRKVSPVPEGMHTATPSLVLADCAKAIEFYKAAFGAKELMRMMMPGTDRVMHAEVRIGDSVLYMNDEMPGGGLRAPSREHAATSSLALYVPDADALFERAVKAGASVIMPMADMFWGDRMGVVTDPHGHSWMIASRTRHLSLEQMRQGAEDFARQMREAPGPMRTAEASASPGVPSAGEPPQMSSPS